MMAAYRIQRQRVKGWKAPMNMVVVSRPSMYSNPYRVGYEVKNNAEAVACFERDLIAARAGKMTVEMLEVWGRNHRAGAAAPFYIVAQVKYLRGQNLACWCPLDQPCHADVLLRMANEEGE